MNIRFKDNKHQERYLCLMEKCKREDCETRPVIFLLALVCENFNQAMECFNFDETHIVLKGLNACWQTSTSVKAIRLAFNLWNGYSDQSDVYQLFGTSLDKYFIEAIKISFSI